jgi:hypothetical protein
MYYMSRNPDTVSLYEPQRTHGCIHTSILASQRELTSNPLQSLLVLCSHYQAETRPQARHDFLQVFIEVKRRHMWDKKRKYHVKERLIRFGLDSLPFARVTEYSDRESRATLSYPQE